MGGKVENAVGRSRKEMMKVLYPAPAYYGVGSALL